MSVTKALQDGLKKANVKAGVAIVLRVDNGQVLSLVSLPSYDNNLFSVGITQTNFDLLNSDPAFQRAPTPPHLPRRSKCWTLSPEGLREAVRALWKLQPKGNAEAARERAVRSGLRKF